MTKVITKTYLPGGGAYEVTYDANDSVIQGSAKANARDPARAYGELQRPETNIFERTTFRWIKGVA